MKRTNLIGHAWLAIGLTMLALSGAAADEPALRVGAVTLNIKSQPIGAALNEFAQQSGLQILFYSDVADDLSAPTLVGSYTADEALLQILSNTGLTYSKVNERTVAVHRVGSSVSEGKAARKEAGRPMMRLANVQIAETPNEDRGIGTAANAPEASAKESDDNNKRQRVVLEEVIVTAQKREESVINVPQSVSVLSADYLVKINALQFRDLADTVPGLSFSTAGAGLTQISLRGVTVGSDISSTVGIYVDEVPYGSSTAFARGAQLALDAGPFDLDRIELLRGPQGTLYGASTMGGLIKYVTKQPDLESFGVDVRTGVSGTRHGGTSYHGAVTLNAPIAADKAALRATGFYSRDGGYIDNLALGQKDVDRSEIFGGRADLLFTPTDALSIRMTGFLQDISRDGFQSAGFTLAGAPVEGSLDQRRLIAEPFDQRFRLISGTVTYDMDWASLTSISSYQTVRTEQLWDLSAAFASLCEFVGRSCSTAGLADNTATDKFTQEVRLASEGAKAIEWLIGGFYTHDDSEFMQEFVLEDLAGQPVPNDLLTLFWPTRYEEYAAFGDLTWHLTDKLNVTGGVRYARNSQSFEQTGSGPFVRSTPTTRSSDDVFTYLANSRYHFNDHAIGYLRYATGYRPGGPNPILIDPTTGRPTSAETFDADRLKSYEAGFKAETADRRFGIDVAGYYIDWTDIQIVVVRGGIGGRANAPGGATIRGAELGLTVRATSAFTVTGAFAYQDGEMSEADADLGVAKGERLPNVPRFTAALNADYDLPIESVKPTIGATLRYVDDRTTSFDNSTSSPQYHTPDYTAVDLRAGFTLGAVDAHLYVRNAFDERGQQRLPLIGIFPASGPILVSILQPRTVGVTLSTKF